MLFVPLALPRFDMESGQPPTTSSLPRIFLYPLAMEIYVWPGTMGASLRASRALPLSTNEYLIEYGFENKVVPVAADLPRF